MKNIVETKSTGGSIPHAVVNKPYLTLGKPFANNWNLPEN